MTTCSGVNELEIIYRAAEANGIPVMFHTGTSIFPGARNKYGDPIYLDDVAVDFPKMKILLAHGGRPLWMDTAFSWCAGTQCVSRHQRDSAEDPVEVFSATRRDCEQDVVWHGLAGAGSAGRGEKFGGFSGSRTGRRGEAADFEPDGVGDLAGVASALSPAGQTRASIRAGLG